MNKKIKVLHIIDNLGLGGAQTMVKNIFEFDQNNKDIFLYSLRTREKNLTIEHSNIFIGKFPKFSFKPLPELVKIIKENNIEILHCHLLKSEFFGWLLKLFYFPKLKLIFHEHGQIVGSEHGHKVEDTLFRFFLKLADKKVDLHIAVSKFISDSLIKNGNISIEKIKTLYNFVDIKKFNIDNLAKYSRKIEREKNGFTEDDFIVGYAGRLVERKGWRDFISAAKEIISQKQNLNIKFIIAGDGKDKDELIEIIKKEKLESQIKYVGHVSDMLSFYSMLDCFVMPSYWEGLPMAQLEVLSLGIPLITSNAPGVNEVATDKKECFYFEIGDSKAITNIIYELSEDKSISKLLSNNAAKLVVKFSLENYMEGLNKVYIDFEL